MTAVMKVLGAFRKGGWGSRSRLTSRSRRAGHSQVGFYMVSGTWGGNFSFEHGARSVVTHQGQWVSCSSVEDRPESGA